MSRLLTHVMRKQPGRIVNISNRAEHYLATALAASPSTR
jgi:hypothetical protein